MESTAQKDQGPSYTICVQAAYSAQLDLNSLLRLSAQIALYVVRNHYYFY